MIWGFIDYENLGSLKGIKFNRYQKLFIFCGPKNSNIKLGDADVNGFLNVELIRLKSTGPNNLDFHIAYYLGKFSETASRDIHFHVISNDHGFSGLVSHIKRMGRSCQRVVPANGEKKTGLSECAEVASERLRHTDGRKRPRREKSLINWLASNCRSIDKSIRGQDILAELVTAGFVENQNSVIKYTLKR